MGQPAAAAEEVKRENRVALVLLSITAFMGPIVGGQVVTDSAMPTPGSSPWISAVLGASDAPLLTHALIAFPALLALLVLLLRRRILQVPNNMLSATMILFFGMLIASIGASSFRGISTAACLEWLAYCGAFYATVAGIGRRQGPVVLSSAVFLGTVIVALKGILEYGVSRKDNPTWRIFAGWSNPNAVAAMFVIGLFLGLGLAITRPRLEALLAVLGTGMIGFAMVLTGSKGALLLAAPIGLSLFCSLQIRSSRAWATPAAVAMPFVVGLVTSVLFLKGIGYVAMGFSAICGFGLLLALGGDGARDKVVKMAGSLALSAVLVVLLSLTPPPGQGSDFVAKNAPYSRVANSAATQEQSSTFRLRLWQGAAQLVQRNPVGSGIGTYRYYSSKPGLTTQTVFAHNAFLQLAVESSVLAPMLLLLAIGSWTLLVVRGLKTSAPETSTLLGAVITAVLALLIHSLVDSDLYYFGAGLSVFMLIGAGMLLAADAVAPEFVAKGLRWASAAGVAAVIASLGYFGYVDGIKAEARQEMAERNPAAVETLASLRGIAPWDAEAWYMSISTVPEGERITAAQKAVELAPWTRNLRVLARMQAQTGHAASALGTLSQALTLDPNNLEALYLEMTIQGESGDPDGAIKTGQRLVAIENTDYFKIRSIDNLVPTQTYMARLFLARSETDPVKKIDLLKGAVAGFLDYAQATVASLKLQLAADPNARFGGQGRTEAVGTLQTALEANKQLTVLYRVRGDAGGLAEADRVATGLSKALDGLESASK